MKEIIIFILLLNSFCNSQENEIIYDRKYIVSAKIIETKENLFRKEYSNLELLLNDKPKLNKRELTQLKSVLKFDSNSYDTIKEKQQILMQIEFKNETILFLISLKQATLFDMRPKKFNFIIILNDTKSQNFITSYLNKNIWLIKFLTFTFSKTDTNL